MGVIWNYNLKPLVEKYKFHTYLESGGGTGSCLKHSQQFDFKELYSIELDEEFAQRLKSFEEDPRVKILQGYSTDCLKDLVPKLSPKPLLFFADGHFCGNPDHHKITYEESIRKYKHLSFPLEEELRILTNERDISKDLVIIDDFHIFSSRYKECAWYQQGNDFKERQLVKDLGIDLNEEVIFNFFKGTHDIELDFRDQIYLIATPK